MGVNGPWIFGGCDGHLILWKGTASFGLLSMSQRRGYGDDETNSVLLTPLDTHAGLYNTRGWVLYEIPCIGQLDRNAFQSMISCRLVGKGIYEFPRLRGLLIALRTSKPMN